MKKISKNTQSKNQGFTLVELIAVIIIISVISIMSFASITKTIKESQLKEIEVFETNLKTAAQVYIETNLADFTELDVVGGSVEITTATLIAKGYLDESISNPSDCSLADSRVLVEKLEDNTIEYSIFCVGDVIPEVPVTYTVYTNGTAVYFNPETGLKCTLADYTANVTASSIGNKTGCMKWYTFIDGGSAVSTVDLLLDHNTTALVAWNSSGSNAIGPNEAFTQLQSDASSWTGVATRTDSYILNNGMSNYTINYSTSKARLITLAELATITGKTPFNELTFTGYFYFETNTITAPSPYLGTYAWLYNYTNTCTTTGCSVAEPSTFGYWTATSCVSGTSDVWRVGRLGGIAGRPVTNNTEFGIRPVITISKSVIQ